MAEIAINVWRLLGAGAIALMTSTPDYALAQSSTASVGDQKPAQQTDEKAQQNGIQDIIVTAQKRSANINSVPQTITAATGDQLLSAGITGTIDLGKIVPSFKYTTNAYGNPVFSIRGVGLQDQSLAASPTVSLYLDEAPLPYALLSHIADFDLNRVEVLKGPQGTLFGQNSTGGAVNYIAAKPTDQFSAGTHVSYGRFNAFDGSAFVSGPLTNTLTARLAVSAQEGGDWQKSYTRDEKLGASRRIFGRLLIDWHPTDRFDLLLNLSAGRDKSDTQAARFISVDPTSIYLPFLPSALINYPLPPNDPRAADWSPGTPLRRDDKQYYVSATAHYDLSSKLVLTAIGEFQDYKTRPFVDTDGTAFHVQEFTDNGHIRQEYGELRLQSQDSGRLKWVIGGNYEHNTADETATTFFPDSHYSSIKQFLSYLFGVPLPGGPLLNGKTVTNSNNTTYAIYGDATWSITPSIDLEGGIRYTDADKKFVGCTLDPGDGAIASLTSFLYGINPPIAPGSCSSFSVIGGQLVPEFARIDFDQHNVSWKTGVTWHINPAQIAYATVSRGYKSGSFPNIGATLNSQFIPANQESLIDYEVGTKLTLFDRRVQLNAAAFYYDYSDKQVLGRVIDPIGGPLPKLINIPRSRVVGVELEATVVPINGLTLHAAGTYVDPKILSDFSTPDEFGATVQIKGLGFPNTPKVSIVADAGYKWSVTDRVSAFVGASALYESDTNGSIGNNPLFNVPAYTTLDLQAGAQSPDGKWSASIWGRNVTNKLYYSTTTYLVDTLVAFAGRPATYGVTLSYRY